MSLQNKIVVLFEIGLLLLYFLEFFSAALHICVALQTHASAFMRNGFHFFLTSNQRIFRLYAFELNKSVYGRSLTLPNNRSPYFYFAGSSSALYQNRRRTPFHFHRIGERLLIAYYPAFAFDAEQNVLVVEALDVALVVGDGSNNRNHIRAVGMKRGALVVNKQMYIACSASRFHLMSSHKFAVYISLSQKIRIGLLAIARQLFVFHHIEHILESDDR